MKISICALLISSIVTAVVSVNGYKDSYLSKVFDEEWETWKTKHGKSYHERDEPYRMKVYLENKIRIERHNRLAHQGQRSFFMKMNHFGDLFHDEFRRTVNGYNMSKLALDMGEQPSTFLGSAMKRQLDLPSHVDWRDKGAVTPVKNQGQCGSCWAFSSTGALEGQHFRKTGNLVSLSEQNLVDCTTKFGNDGCEGGLMRNAFRYVKQNGGIDTESSYPYEADEEPCHFHKNTIGATDTGFVAIPKDDEEALKEALATVGPVSVAIDASPSSFQFYSHGVYTEEECSPDALDHGVLVVGYGKEDGQDYWLIKNSWDVSWGDKGYIKMNRENNMCGVATQASYPLV